MCVWENLAVQVYVECAVDMHLVFIGEIAGCVVKDCYGCVHLVACVVI